MGINLDIRSPLVNYQAGASTPKWLIIAKNVCHNLALKIRRSFGHTEALIGSTHRALPVSASVEYINRVFNGYLAYGSVSLDEICDKAVLELGPGDNLGVALRFLAAGASRVVCLDKFFSLRDVERERSIYLALRDRCSPLERGRFDAAIRLDSGVTINPDRLEYRHGMGVEELGNQPGYADAGFDLILSRAVLMEIHESDRAFVVLDRLLRPGGRMIHKIAPLRDYGLFTLHGYHPLEFLTIPDLLYTLMASDSGKPNRKLVGYYQEKMRELSYDATFHITRVLDQAGEDLPPGVTQWGQDGDALEGARAVVRAIRPRLLPRFRLAPDVDLMLEDFFLVARKPAFGN